MQHIHLGGMQSQAGLEGQLGVWPAAHGDQSPVEFDGSCAAHDGNITERIGKDVRDRNAA